MNYAVQKQMVQVEGSMTSMRSTEKKALGRVVRYGFLSCHVRDHPAATAFERKRTHGSTLVEAKPKSRPGSLMTSDVMLYLDYYVGMFGDVYLVN